MQQNLDRYGTGVFMQKVTLQNVQPPDKVQAAFDDAVKAGQDRERLKNEGQAYANDVARTRAARRRGCWRRRRLPDRSRAARAGRRRALQPGARRVPEGARRHARAALSRHDASVLGQFQQGAGRPEKRQPALPAARQADPAVGGAGGRRRRARRGAAATHASRSVRSIRRARATRCAAGSGHDEVLDADPRRGRRAAVLPSQSVYTVDQRKYAIKFQLGEVVETKTTAGLYFKMPLVQNIKF